MTPRLATTIAVGLAASAGIHAAVAVPHWSESAAHGAFFVAAAVLQATLALIVVRRPARRQLQAVAATGITLIALWVVSRTVGLPLGDAPGVAEPVGFADAAAVLFEAFTVAGALVLLRRPPVALRPQRTLRGAVSVAAVMIVASGVAVAAPTSHGHHDGRHTAAHHDDEHGALHVEGVHLHGLREAGDIDPGRDPGRSPNAPIDGLAVATGREPVAVTGGAGSVWVANRSGNSVSRIDPATRRVVATIAVAAQPADLSFGFGALWVASYGTDVVQRIDPATDAVTATLAVGVGPSAILAARSGIWVATVTEGTVQRIDPSTLDVSAPIATGFGPIGLADAGDAIWVSHSLDRTVTRIDVATRRAGTPIPVDAGASGVTVAFGHIWVASTSTGTIARIHPLGGREASLRVDDRSLPGLGPSSIVAARGRLWVANNHDKTIVSVDPATGRTGAPLFFDNRLASYPGQVRLAEIGGALWVTDFEAGTVVRVPIGEEETP